VGGVRSILEERRVRSQGRLVFRSAGAPELLVLCCLTLELSGRRRCDARPARRRITNSAARAWWRAVGSPLEREVMRSPAEEAKLVCRGAADREPACEERRRRGRCRSVTAHAAQGCNRRREQALRRPCERSRRTCGAAGALNRLLPKRANGSDGEPATHNVRAKRATAAGRQARAGENVPRTARPGLVACRWRSA
jgi:hypothetical protein